MNAKNNARHRCTLGDVLVPLADYGQTPASILHARKRWLSVVAAMLTCRTPSHVLLHYVQVAAREVEIELRNRQSARLGSLYFDISVPVELECEIERRMNAYIESAPGDTHDEMLRVLKVYQAMSEVLSGLGTPDCSNMVDELQAMFFCIVHMSRDLQSLLFASTHRMRLPQHLPVGRDEGLRFMEVLRLLTPLYTSKRLDSAQYVERLRKFVFFGSLELDCDADTNDNEDETTSDEQQQQTETEHLLS